MIDQVFDQVFGKFGKIQFCLQRILILTVETINPNSRDQHPQTSTDCINPDEISEKVQHRNFRTCGRISESSYATSQPLSKRRGEPLSRPRYSNSTAKLQTAEKSLGQRRFGRKSDRSNRSDKIYNFQNFRGRPASKKLFLRVAV